MADLLAAGAPRESMILLNFEDAFLIRTTSLFNASERQRMVNPRMVNPRKAYPTIPRLRQSTSRTSSRSHSR